MAMRGVDFKWYDGFFLSMLATSVIIVAINWKRYRLCEYPLHVWIVVDYTTVFVFRLLMFVDNGLAAGLGFEWEISASSWGFWKAAALPSVLRQGGGSLYPFFASLSISMVMDCNWNNMVYKSKKLFTRRRSKMGFPYLATLQLLWTPLHYLLVYWKVVDATTSTFNTCSAGNSCFRIWDSS